MIIGIDKIIEDKKEFQKIIMSMSDINEEKYAKYVAAEISSKYRKLSLKYHPDRFGQKNFDNVPYVKQIWFLLNSSKELTMDYVSHFTSYLKKVREYRSSKINFWDEEEDKKKFGPIQERIQRIRDGDNKEYEEKERIRKEKSLKRKEEEEKERFRKEKSLKRKEDEEKERIRKEKSLKQKEDEEKERIRKEKSLKRKEDEEEERIRKEKSLKKKEDEEKERIRKEKSLKRKEEEEEERIRKEKSLKRKKEEEEDKIRKEKIRREDSIELKIQRRKQFAEDDKKLKKEREEEYRQKVKREREEEEEEEEEDKQKILKRKIDDVEPDMTDKILYNEGIKEMDVDEQHSRSNQNGRRKTDKYTNNKTKRQQNNRKKRINDFMRNKTVRRRELIEKLRNIPEKMDVVVQNVLPKVKSKTQKKISVKDRIRENFKSQ